MFSCRCRCPGSCRCARPEFVLHRLWLEPDQDALLKRIAPRSRAIATGVNILAEGMIFPVTGDFMRGCRSSRSSRTSASATTTSTRNGPQRMDRRHQHTGRADRRYADTAFGPAAQRRQAIPAAERYLRARQVAEARLSADRLAARAHLRHLGLGRIGKAIARRAEGFGLKVIYHSRNRAQDVAYPYCNSLLEPAKACDILMVVVPGGPETRNALNAQVLRRLDPTAFSSTSRAAPWSTSALIKALQDKTILTAALDVFAPTIRMSLRNFWRWTMLSWLPHVGSASQATRDAMTVSSSTIF